jgi:hypothetical protein
LVTGKCYHHLHHTLFVQSCACVDSLSVLGRAKPSMCCTCIASTIDRCLALIVWALFGQGPRRPVDCLQGLALCSNVLQQPVGQLSGQQQFTV